MNDADESGRGLVSFNAPEINIFSPSYHENGERKPFQNVPASVT